MTPITVQTAIAGSQLAATPRERSSADDIAEPASFAATLAGALSPSGRAEPAGVEKAPGARGAARTAAAKNGQQEQADGNLLAALLTLDPLAHGARAEVAQLAGAPGATRTAAASDDRQEQGDRDQLAALLAPNPLAHVAAAEAAQLAGAPVAAAPNGAAPAAALLDGASAPASLAPASRAPASLASPPGAAAGHRAALPANTLQPAQPLADVGEAVAAVASALRAAPARVDAAAAPTTPIPDAATAHDRTSSEPAALRMIGGQPPRALQSSQSPVDARQPPLPQARAVADTPPQPLASPLGASLPASGGTAVNQPGPARWDDAPHMAPATATPREAAAADTPAALQVALSRPAGPNRDQHADEAADRTIPAAPGAASTQPPPTGGDFARAGAAVAQVAPPVGSERWGAALSQHIARLSSGGEVELNLNPAELGPLKVKLSLGDGQAQVLFVSEHLMVRQAIEAAIPQLRSSLADNGISLGQATVGSGSGEAAAQQRQQQQPAPQQPRTFQADTTPGEAARPPVAARQRGAASAVDTFA